MTTAAPERAAVVGGGAASDAPEDQRALDLLDRLGDLDAARAGVGAVEGRAAAPHALAVVEDLEPLLGALVAAVEDEAVGRDDRLRAEVALVGPVDRARGRARCAHDALRRVVEPLAVLRGLQALAGGLAAVGDEEGLDRPERLEERLHVDDEVLLDRQPLDGLDEDLVAQVLDQHLAGEPVDAVDAHGVRAAHAVGAGAAERERPVLVPLHVVQRVEQPVALLHGDLEGLPAGVLAGLRVEAADLERHLAQVVLDRRLLGSGALFHDRHQYLRSIGT